MAASFSQSTHCPTSSANYYSNKNKARIDQQRFCFVNDPRRCRTRKVSLKQISDGCSLIKAVHLQDGRIMGGFCLCQHVTSSEVVRMLTKLFAKGTTSKLSSSIRLGSKRSTKDLVVVGELGRCISDRIVELLTLVTKDCVIWEYFKDAIDRLLKSAATMKSSPDENDGPVNILKDGILSVPPVTPPEDSLDIANFDVNKDKSTVSITVVGASGDLAKKKIFPALFALYYEGCLPEHFTIFGYARSKMSDAELRTMVSKTLTCRIDQRENCGEKMDQFLERCFYHPGQYDSEENFLELDKKLKKHEDGRVANRLFYLSIPPNIFIDAVKCASSSASSANGWTRVIVEKPFGRDSASSAALTSSLKQYLDEDQIFRIDHYLGKELVENLSVLRFSNLIFEPLWSRQYIRNVQFIFAEDFGTEGRGGYFDNYGIIRDIMQNHLLQILALFAMETPVSLDAEDIRNEKVKVLRSMRPLKLDDVVIGQYKSHTRGGVKYPAYTDDKTVPKDSLTPTFAAAALFIDNARWDGVPFLMKAGKALNSRGAEIRVQFRHVPGNLYNKKIGTELDLTTNELVIRVQPDEAIYLKINNKVPGLGMRLDQSNLNLLYASRYDKEIPDAYERLLLDAIEGERRLFIRSDELDAAWSLFTPVLKELEEKKIVPEYYPYGSRGPVGSHYLAARYKVRWGDNGSEQ